MDFTFGIITSKYTNQYLNLIIDSIHSQEIPNYEIIIVGECTLNDEKVKVIPFDETTKSGWITRKKNIICQLASYENIVLIHDYIQFDIKWYSGFLKFGNDFKFCVSRVKTNDNKRYRDYLFFPGMEDIIKNRTYFVPYNHDIPEKLKKLMYISGAYYIIKKNIALEFPLNENLCHMQGEDVELSQRLAKNNIFISFNDYSTVVCLKDRSLASWENPLTNLEIEHLKTLDEDTIHNIFEKQIKHIQDNYINK